MIFASVNAFSQSKKFDPNADHENFFRIGAKAGVNVNKINGQAYKDGFNYNYLLGVFMQFNFSKTFGLQPNLILFSLHLNLQRMLQPYMMIYF